MAVDEGAALDNMKMIYVEYNDNPLTYRVAELGKAKMAMKIFFKRVFTIFTSNASFLCVIANLQN